MASAKTEKDVNKDAKIEILFDWIRNLDEEALDSLIEEYIEEDFNDDWASELEL